MLSSCSCAGPPRARTADPPGPPEGDHRTARLVARNPITGRKTVEGTWLEIQSREAEGTWLEIQSRDVEGTWLEIQSLKVEGTWLQVMTTGPGPRPRADQLKG